LLQDLLERDLDVREFQERPVFCFTTDIEWSPESMIKELVDTFDGRGIPLTPFVTHDSPTIKEKYGQGDKRLHVGLHPNFLSGTTHGDSPERVIDNVGKLWKDAISFRSHSFFDNTHITDEFAKRGFRYDSNINLFLHNGGLPLIHNSGLLRFPVYWEDDTHFDRQLPFTLDYLKRHLDAPGLKVFNIHPLTFSLNVPTSQYYRDHKHLYNSQDDETWRKFAFTGQGVRTLVEAVLDYVTAQGYRTAYLYDLFLQVMGEQPRPVRVEEAPKQIAQPATEEPNRLEVYLTGDVEKRSEMVRENYDTIADNVGLYTTSRDFNLRELEIDFVLRNIKDGDVLDMGCGNGYTLIRVAQEHTGRMVGLDFSANMIEGAKILVDKFSDQLKVKPDFQVADVRKLDYPDNSFDYIISERLIQNLPTKQVQLETIREAHRVLKPGGTYYMIEGTDSGLQRLNVVRAALGLDVIEPFYAEFNVSALRFNEEEINAFLETLYDIEDMHFFGTYYLISRVLHPMLVAPATPKWDAKINRLAREIAKVLPDVGKIGHVVGYKLVARK
jgi:ubiquinone/menaquinone biosynthesis C-methylase UbiE